MKTYRGRGKPSYLEPNRDSLQMPIGGLLGLAENVGGRVAIGEKTAQWHVENSSAKLPKPSMLQTIYTLNKGAIEKNSTSEPPTKPDRTQHANSTRNTQHQKTAHRNTRHLKRPNLQQHPTPAPLATLIPNPATLISATNASKTDLATYANRHHQTARQRQRRLENGSA